MVERLDVYQRECYNQIEAALTSEDSVQLKKVISGKVILRTSMFVSFLKHFSEQAKGALGRQMLSKRQLGLPG